MTKNWTGDTNSVFKTLGATSHTEEEREQDDYYATDPYATECLLEIEEINKEVLDPAVGAGHLVLPLKAKGYNITGFDIVDRGFPEVKIQDFLESHFKFNGDIVVNPPYKYAKNFIEKSLETITTGNKVFAFLKIQFLESKGRKQFFLDNPPKTVWVASSRIKCAKNGDFDSVKGSAVSYCWYVWEKGYKGDTTIKWFN